jgi:hypothetical protein
METSKQRERQEEAMEKILFKSIPTVTYFLQPSQWVNPLMLLEPS